MLRKFLSLMIPLSAVLLLLFWGWGFDDFRQYFSNPARAGLIYIAILSAGIALVFGLDLQPVRRGRMPVGHQSTSLFLLAIASLGIVWFLPFADHRRMLTLGASQAPRYAGLLLCTAGATVRLLALAKLGKQFSAYVTLQEAHQLVQSGIYKIIRHPLYLSLLLAAPGFALVFDSILVWPILAVTTAFVARRILQEDRLLKAEFGASFEEYRNRTSALLPLIL